MLLTGAKSIYKERKTSKKEKCSDVSDWLTLKTWERLLPNLECVPTFVTHSLDTPFPPILLQGSSCGTKSKPGSKFD